MRGLISMFERLFKDEFPWVVDQEQILLIQGFLYKSDKPNWSLQLQMHEIKNYIDTYGQAEYYALLTDKIRKYKLSKRLVLNS